MLGPRADRRVSSVPVGVSRSDEAAETMVPLALDFTRAIVEYRFMITVDPVERVAVLRSDEVCYAFAWADPESSSGPAPGTTPGRDLDTPLRHLHWGGPLTDSDLVALRDIPHRVRRRTSSAASPRASDEEFPTWGGLRREDVALKVEMADRVRSLDLHVQGVSEGADGASIVARLVDDVYPVAVELIWCIDATSGAVTRQATIHNEGDTPIVLEQAFSASWPVPRRPAQGILSLTGMYGAESRITRAPLINGSYTVQSRCGIPGHDALPFLAVVAGDPASTGGAVGNVIGDEIGEEHGEIWSVALEWSGSFRLTAFHADDDSVHLLGGPHDIDFRHTLPPGRRHTTPPMTGVYSSAGRSGMTHAWHTYQRERLLPRAREDRPIIYNSWEAAYYDLHAEQQIQLAEAAADLGAELFVIDDGWFAGRTEDTRGLGDWRIDLDRFPEGGRALSDRVHAMGMKFGLWVEPEMLNRDSDLFRAHPDWIYRWPTRTPPEPRSQLMIDFSRTEVQDWAVQTLSRLVAEYDLDYLKWDMNRPLTEPVSPAVTDTGTVWVEHVRGLYRVWDALRSAHPKLWLETCASGGGRSDLGALGRTHWAWPSDNTDPLARIAIQEGFALINPPSTMAAWVTDSPTPLGMRVTPLTFRFHVAMCGVLGLGGDVASWPEEDRATARRLVALYTQIRPLVQHGQMVRLPSPAPGRTTAIGYVSENRRQAAVIVLAEAVLHTAERQLIRLRGLDADRTYAVQDTETGEGWIMSGSGLMSHGLLVALAGSYASTILTITAQD